MVTSAEIRIFQTATPSEIAQVQSLVARGKGFATRGHPRYQAIMSVLGSLSQVERDKAIQEAKERGEITGVTEAGELYLERPLTETEKAQEFLEQAGVPTGDIQEQLRQRERGELTTEQITQEHLRQFGTGGILLKPEEAREMGVTTTREGIPFIPAEEVDVYEPPKTILGEEPFNIWKTFLYAGRLIEKSPSTQKVIEKTKDTYPLIYRALTKPSPQIVEDIAQSVFLFSFFSPAMSLSLIHI